MALSPPFHILYIIVEFQVVSYTVLSLQKNSVCQTKSITTAIVSIRTFIYITLRFFSLGSQCISMKHVRGHVRGKKRGLSYIEHKVISAIDYQRLDL